MLYDIASVKEDFRNLSVHEFFNKYYISDDTWYIEEYLNHTAEEAKQLTELYKSIIANSVRVDTAKVFMIGSAKMGFSLTPPKEGVETKLFKPFDKDGVSRKKSDIDIAIVSPELFERFWKLYRTSYKPKFETIYTHYIFGETYRGYVSERNVQLIDGVRLPWNEMLTPARKELKRKIGFMHDINFRVYHSLFDFEDYSKKTINDIKRRKLYEVV